MNNGYKQEMEKMNSILSEASRADDFSRQVYSKMGASLSLFLEMDEAKRQSDVVMAMYADCSQLLDDGIRNIMAQPRRLTDEEFKIVNTHPQRSVDILLKNGIGEVTMEIYGSSYYTPELESILKHHWKTNQVEESMEIGGNDTYYDEQANKFLLATAVTAMAMNRPDRAPMPSEAIVQELKNGVERNQFSQANVERFLSYIEKNPNWRETLEQAYSEPEKAYDEAVKSIVQEKSVTQDEFLASLAAGVYEVGEGDPTNKAISFAPVVEKKIEPGAIGE